MPPLTTLLFIVHCCLSGRFSIEVYIEIYTSMVLVTNGLAASALCIHESFGTFLINASPFAIVILPLFHLPYLLPNASNSLLLLSGQIPKQK